MRILKLSVSFLVSSIVSATAVFGIYMITIGERSNIQLEGARNLVWELSREFEKAKAARADEELLSREVTEIRQEIEELRSVLPCEIDKFEVMAEIIALTEDLGIQLSIVDTTLEPIEREFYREKPFFVAVQAVPRSKLIEFYEALHASKSTIEVTHGSLPYPSDAVIDVHFTVAAYSELCPTE